MPFDHLSFFPNDEIEATDDGFLIVKNEWKAEKQPLLLRSTEALLGQLLPSVARSARFQHPDRIDETFSMMEVDTDDDQDGGKKKNKKKTKSKIAPEYHAYQDLSRVVCLSNSIQSAVLDISKCRHRPAKDKNGRNEPRMSKAEKKIRSLEGQQQRMLSQQSEISGDTSDEENMEEDDDDEEDSQREPDYLRLLRTCNSIRALYPHLLHMLNHPRRNDKNLKIREVEYQAKRKNAMCWVLGSKVFSTTSGKCLRRIQQDAKIILKGYIDTALAAQIFEREDGFPEFWNKQWVEQLEKRSSIEVPYPLTVLSNCQDTEVASIEKVAQQCDQDLLSTNKSENSPAIQKKYENTITQLHQRISKLLGNRFPKARLSIYGSCLSNLSLGVGADVDLSLWIPEAERIKTGFQEGKIGARKYEGDMKKLVYRVFHTLKNRDQEFRDMQPITRARVPVIKGKFMQGSNPYSPDGSINFDICFLNDIAVANSRLLHNYSLVDPRARSLMMAVKQWTTDNKINSAKDNTISSYAWINLCIFYLQCINFVPNLQSRQLMEEVKQLPSPEGKYWHNVNKLDTFCLTWNDVQKAGSWTQPPEHRNTPVSALLYGFFEFYARRFPSALFAVSIKQGRICIPKFAFPNFAFRKISLFLSIEDPFETYDSHCPHDLGTPASDDGVRDIVKCLEDGESHLRDVLVGNKKSDGKLWSGAPLKGPEPSRKSEQKSGGNKNIDRNQRRRQNKKGGQNNGDSGKNKPSDKQKGANSNDKDQSKSSSEKIANGSQGTGPKKQSKQNSRRRYRGPRGNQKKPNNEKKGN